jgi:hypothetical protein
MLQLFFCYMMINKAINSFGSIQMKAMNMEGDSILINPNDLDEVIGKLTQELQAWYVYPQIATQLCESLQNHLKNGDYNVFKSLPLLT